MKKQQNWFKACKLLLLTIPITALAVSCGGREKLSQDQFNFLFFHHVAPYVPVFGSLSQIFPTEVSVDYIIDKADPTDWDFWLDKPGLDAQISDYSVRMKDSANWTLRPVNWIKSLYSDKYYDAVKTLHDNVIEAIQLTKEIDSNLSINKGLDWIGLRAYDLTFLKKGYTPYTINVILAGFKADLSKIEIKENDQNKKI